MDIEKKRNEYREDHYSEYSEIGSIPPHIFLIEEGESEWSFFDVETLPCFEKRYVSEPLIVKFDGSEIPTLAFYTYVTWEHEGEIDTCEVWRTFDLFSAGEKKVSSKDKWRLMCKDFDKGILNEIF